MAAELWEPGAFLLSRNNLPVSEGTALSKKEDVLSESIAVCEK